ATPPIYRADFGGVARSNAVAAECDGKIYLGTGLS
ncbi:unnamed protein product, partial [marine sediment metagenome]